MLSSRLVQVRPSPLRPNVRRQPSKVKIVFHPDYLLRIFIYIHMYILVYLMITFRRRYRIHFAVMVIPTRYVIIFRSSNYLRARDAVQCTWTYYYTPCPFEELSTVRRNGRCTGYALGALTARERKNRFRHSVVFSPVPRLQTDDRHLCSTWFDYLKSFNGLIFN